ncbi:MAG: hypothetical protein OXQ28_13495 [Acidobacteriota bacterium]|nr:hypothetical protein [Acidobacteriota bacterium]
MPRENVRVRQNKGRRSEPRAGWPLGVKTSVPSESGPEPELSPSEAARQDAVDALDAKRRSDQMARRDQSDLALDEHHVQPGLSPFRRRSGGNEPRTPFGGDPAEERRIAARAAGGESPSAWVQDTRAPHYRESWDEQQAARLRNEGEAAERELRGAVRGGLSELVRVRTVVLADQLTPSAAELERLEQRPALESDGRRANRRDRAQVVADGVPLAPRLGDSLVHAEVDPALLALAAGKYSGAVLEPPVDPQWLQGPGRDVDTPFEAHEAIQFALDGVEAACFERWREDPGRAESLERRWERERDQLWDSASGSGFPEETRLMVEGMREYAADLTERARALCYVDRIHTAVGRDFDSLPLPDDVLDRANACRPDLIAGIREADPDSPLCVVPAGVGEAEHARLVAGALDAARTRVVDVGRDGLALDPDLVSASVLDRVAEGVAVLERGRDAGAEERDASVRVVDAGARADAGTVGVLREREERELLDRAGQRFRDVSDVLASGGVFFEVGSDPGAARHVSAGLVVEVSAQRFEQFSGRGRDGEWFEAPVPKGSADEQRAAAAEALRGFADVLWDQGSDVPEGASERFGERMAARIYELPLPLPQAVSADAEQAASKLASEVWAEVDDLSQARGERVAAREAAVERFDKVLDALSGRVAVTMRNRLVDEDQRIGFTVRRDSASGDVTAEVFVDPGVRHGDRSLTNVRLAELHGEAYVDLGRALGATDPGRAADWSKVYGAVASTGEDGRGVTVSVGSCAVNTPQRDALVEARALAAALREQVRADGFATEQMRQTWPRAWREETPRVVERVDGKVRIADARIGGLGPPRRVNEVLERDGKQLARDIKRSNVDTEKLVRAAVSAPASSQGPAEPPRAPGPVQGQDRAEGPRNQQEVLDEKLSVAR